MGRLTVLDDLLDHLPGFFEVVCSDLEVDVQDESTCGSTS
jgi:hypothetical protein